MSLPDPVLDGFLVKLEEDEELESKQIKKRWVVFLELMQFFSANLFGH